MPLVNGPTRQPSFEDFVDRGKEEAVPAQLNDARARVEAGADSFPPYEEGDVPRMLTSTELIEDEDKKEK